MLLEVYQHRCYPGELRPTVRKLAQRTVNGRRMVLIDRDSYLGSTRYSPIKNYFGMVDDVQTICMGLIQIFLCDAGSFLTDSVARKNFLSGVANNMHFTHIWL